MEWPKIKPFTLNGWKIVPCDDFGHVPDGGGFYLAYDVVSGAERYHHEGLESAVAAAQIVPRELPDPITPDLSAKLYACLSEAWDGGGIQGSVDYTLQNLEQVVREAIEEARP
jgi:hypothetical protein